MDNQLEQTSRERDDARDLVAWQRQLIERQLEQVKTTTNDVLILITRKTNATVTLQDVRTVRHLHLTLEFARADDSRVCLCVILCV